MNGNWEEIVKRVAGEMGDEAGSILSIGQIINASNREEDAVCAASRRSAINRALTVIPVPDLAGGGLQSSIATAVASVLGTREAANNELASSVESTLLSTLTLAPVVSGLLSLFGIGREEAVAAPVRFSLPPAVSAQEGISRAAGTVPVEASYDQNGLSRAVNSSAPAQVVIQVQAIDTRSFLDHSEAIANAVREAMLHSHSLNDVVMEL